MTPQEIELYAYGALIGVVCLLAWFSGDTVIRRVSWLSLLGWALANIAVEWLGFAKAPLLLPTLDAVIAIGVGVLGYRNRSLLCFVIVLLYLAQETVAVAGFAMQRQSELWYFATQNGMFILRMLALGGWAVGALVVDRGLRRGLGVVPGRSPGRQEP